MANLMAHEDGSAQLCVIPDPVDLFALSVGKNGGVHQKETDALDSRIEVLPNGLRAVSRKQSTSMKPLTTKSI